MDRHVILRENRLRIAELYLEESADDDRLSLSWVLPHKAEYARFKVKQPHENRDIVPLLAEGKSPS